MSSGKETPRQKMIGMMYLVLTALLALNVSKEILKGFVMVDESLEKSKLILDENNSRVKLAFEDYVKKGNSKAKPYLLKAIETQKSIRLVDSYIDSMKLHIERKTEGVSVKDTSQLRFMETLDDFDTPTYMLIGSDETRPIHSKYSAKDLRLQLSTLHSQLISMIDNMQKDNKTKLEIADLNTLKQKLNNIKPMDRNIEDNGVKLNWELENFYHMPMAAVITNLNKIQADMKNVESEFLHVFSAAAGKFDIKITGLEAKVVAPTAYVLAGQSFKANIMLGASSSDITEDKMQILLGAEYDTLSKSFKTPGTPMPITNGMGKYETTVSGSGERELKGVVVYKNPRGEDEFYPFDFSYMVAPPFTSVAAENMNIFYAGVNNPVSVSAAGFSPTQLRVTVNGCGSAITKDASGNYQVTAKTTGTCLVTVSANTSEGFKQQGPPKIFRVKGIPPPVLKVANVLATSNLEFTRNQILSIGGIGAESPGFMFPVNMTVKSFVLGIFERGSYVPYPCYNSNLSASAKDALTRIRPGQKVYIDDIKVQTPTGLITLPNTQIKMKS